MVEKELCELFSKNLNITHRPTKIKLFIKLSKFDEKNPDNFKIVNVNSFTGEYSDLSLGNGGSWCRKSAWSKYKVATLKNNRNLEYLWDADDDEKKNVIDAFSNCPKKKGNKIQYIGIFGLINNDNSRPIRQDIKDYIRKLPCCSCSSTSNVETDHKNDLYNDKRVLDLKTQTIDDFQPLCKHCNCRKRQIIKNTIKTGKRYGATNIPCLNIYGIDFIQGNDVYDPDDINAMVGTYWYDPIAFHKGIFNILSKTL